MPQNPRSPTPRAPHVVAAIGAGLQAKTQAKTPARGPGAMAPHVQRAVQATLQAKPASPAVRVAAPHVQAALSRSPPSRAASVSPQLQRKVRGPATGSIQPCSALIHTLTCGLFGSPAPVTNNDGGGSVPLIDRGSASSTAVPSSAVKKKGRTMVGLDQGNSGLIPYGGAAMNLSTTTCGLVILHTDGAEAVGYHWPFCQESRTYEGHFESAIQGRQGTKIEVVVNGGRYRTGDKAPAAFGLYLNRTYNLPVSVYRQVVGGSDSQSDSDPWVNVDSGGVSPPVSGYALVPV